MTRQQRPSGKARLVTIRDPETGGALGSAEKTLGERGTKTY